VRRELRRLEGVVRDLGELEALASSRISSSMTSKSMTLPGRA
jgi:hypothetical protein